MSNWILIIAVVILAPTFIISTFSNGVNFISTQGKELVKTLVKEGVNTFQEMSQ